MESTLNCLAVKRCNCIQIVLSGFHVWFSLWIKLRSFHFNFTFWRQHAQLETLLQNLICDGENQHLHHVCLQHLMGVCDDLVTSLHFNGNVWSLLTKVQGIYFIMPAAQIPIMLLFSCRGFALKSKWKHLVIMPSSNIPMNIPNRSRQPPTYTYLGGYDAANRDATNLPPSRQITGSWTLAAAARGAIRSMS